MGINCLACNNCAVASTEMTVQNLEEKAELNETIERLKAQFLAVSGNLEVQTADNSQLSRYRHAAFICFSTYSNNSDKSGFLSEILVTANCHSVCNWLCSLTHKKVMK